MSKPDMDMPLRRCPFCDRFHIEDDRMYHDVEVCPHCGRRVTDAASGDKRPDPLDLL